MYPVDRNSGHLDPGKMKSALLPAQREVLAMSRAQYLAFLRDFAAQETVALQGAGSWGRNGRRGNDEDDSDNETHDKGRSGSENREAMTLRPADKLSVGVCVFRLDGQTLRPVVLLLRRSPAWWRCRVFSSAGEWQGAGGWELPGGKVGHDDFCISAAIERLVREQTGLRVTKIMGMLSDVRWRTELKVLLWEECEEGSEEDGNGYTDERSDHEEMANYVDPSVNMDRTTSVQSDRSGSHYSDDDNDSESRKPSSSTRGTLTISPSYELEILGVRILTDSSSPKSSRLPLTPDSGSSFIPAPAPPPGDGGYDEYDNSYHHHQTDNKIKINSDNSHNSSDDDSYNNNRGNNDGYNNDSQSDNIQNTRRAYAHDCHSDHDQSLEPAPLTLPSRERTLRRSATVSSTTLPESLLSLQPPARSARRNAAIIPYKMTRREWVQLNFTVLVDEEPDEEEPLPAFLERYAGDHGFDYDGGGGEREGEKGEGEEEGGEEGQEQERGQGKLYEHDALEWATCARVESLPMSEDLRRVIFEGLDWMGELTGGFF